MHHSSESPRCMRRKSRGLLPCGAANVHAQDERRADGQVVHRVKLDLRAAS